MKTRSIIILFVAALLSSASVFAAGEVARKEFNVLYKVFLGSDEKANNEILAEIKKVTVARKHLVHAIVFPAEIQKDQVVQEELKWYNIATFPAIVLDEKILDKLSDLDKTTGELSKIDRVTVFPHLEKEVDEKNNLAAMGYVCCFVESQGIEKGRVMIYVVDETPQKDGSILPIFRGLINDALDYTIDPGSCHPPETYYWPIPKEIDPKNLKLIMVTYDGKEKMLGACCSTDCSEISSD